MGDLNSFFFFANFCFLSTMSGNSFYKNKTERPTEMRGRAHINGIIIVPEI